MNEQSTTPVLQEPGPTLYGRLYHPDTRDFSYPMKAPSFSLRLERHWKIGDISDQGALPHCVGHAWSQFLRSAPVMERKNRPLPSPSEIYNRAQLVDEWPGEAYDGTSVRAGAKVLHAFGLITEYQWAKNIEVVKNYILTRGPVVVGTDWFSGMDNPEWRDDGRKSGVKNDAYLIPAGAYRGGHAYMLSGYSRRRHAFRMVNSWGRDFAEAGRAWIEYAAMNRLLFQLNGEACSALEPHGRSAEPLERAA